VAQEAELLDVIHVWREVVAEPALCEKMRELSEVNSDSQVRLD
jgi:hypothetical protein